MSENEGMFSSVQSEVEELTRESHETIQASLNEINNSIGNQRIRIMAESERQARWKTENERRRHNYVPLIFELL